MSSETVHSCFNRKEPSLIIHYSEEKNKHLQFKNLSVMERHVIMRNDETSWSVISFEHDDHSTLISVIHWNNIRYPKILSPEEQEIMDCFRKDHGLLYNQKATELANKLDSELKHCIIGDCAFILDDVNERLQNKILNMLHDSKVEAPTSNNIDNDVDNETDDSNDFDDDSDDDNDNNFDDSDKKSNDEITEEDVSRTFARMDKYIHKLPKEESQEIIISIISNFESLQNQQSMSTKKQLDP